MILYDNATIDDISQKGDILYFRLKNVAADILQNEFSVKSIPNPFSPVISHRVNTIQAMKDSALRDHTGLSVLRSALEGAVVLLAPTGSIPVPLEDLKFIWESNR